MSEEPGLPQGATEPTIVDHQHDDLKPTTPYPGATPIEQSVYETSYKAARAMWENQELKHDATHDNLTGLLNLRGLDHYIANNSLEGKVVLFADGTNIKSVNDNIGHSRGDEAIIGLANVLRVSLRKEDIIARIGGDEFVSIIDPSARDGQGSIEDTLEATNERIRLATAKLLQDNPDLAKNGMDFAVGTTTGHEEMTVQQILDAAEKKMNLQKDEQHVRNGKYR